MKIEESFEMLIDAHNANPDSHYILDSLAWAYFKKKDFVKAAELMEEVIDMVPGEAISLDHLGDIYFAMNRKREAAYFWKQARDLAKPEDKIIENTRRLTAVEGTGLTFDFQFNKPLKSAVLKARDGEGVDIHLKPIVDGSPKFQILRDFEKTGDLR